MNELSKIPVFILAGGLGSRLSEETYLIPKPMIEIGGIPIIVHIMRWYYSFGFNDFIICAGYKSWEIKNYFLNYDFRQNDIEIDLRNNNSIRPLSLHHAKKTEKWRVRVLDTGLDTLTGTRLAKAFDVIHPIENFQHFALTYGDGLCNVNLREEFQFHLNKNTVGTVLGVAPQSRFGEMQFGNDGLVTHFHEKPNNSGGGVNGGFFFFKSSMRDYLHDSESGENLALEKKPLEQLTLSKQLSLYQHQGFWQCMDTLRDKISLQQIWEGGHAPWKVN